MWHQRTGVGNESLAAFTLSPSVSVMTRKEINKRCNISLVLVVAFAAACILATLLALHLDAFAAGFSGADESAHFLNAYFVGDYLSQTFGANPAAAARDFYLHYPKLSIGHWPPLHYVIVGSLFTVVQPTFQSAMIINMIFTVLPVLFVVFVTHRLAGYLAALAAGIWYVCLPVVTQNLMFFMADQPLAAWLCATTAAWVYYVEKSTLLRAATVASLAVAAILTKGNGWLVVLFPFVHLALTGRWSVLRNWRIYLAAAFALAALVPWYLLTLSIAADGWLYRPGIAYAASSLAENARSLYANIGAAGLALAMVGTVRAWRVRHDQWRRWNWAAASVALVLATLIFQAAVPASLEARYLTPTLPPLVALAVSGLVTVLHWLKARGQSIAATSTVGTVLGALLLVPAIRFLNTEPQKVNLRLDTVADEVVRATESVIWLIDGSAGAEGAFIGEVAFRDSGRALYVARTSQLLAKSGWGGQRYELKVDTPAAVIDQLQKLGVAGVVVVRRNQEQVFAHSRLLEEALRDPVSGFRLVGQLEHGSKPGSTLVYRRVEGATSRIDLLREFNYPAKAKSLGVKD